MNTQHFEAIRLDFGKNDALASQCRRLSETRYQWQITSCNVRLRNTRVSLTSESGRARLLAVQRPSNIDRRLKCQRALNCWQRSALLQPFLRAQASRTTSMLWLHQSLSHKSLYTQVNTSNTPSGQAVAPVLTHHVAAKGRAA